MSPRLLSFVLLAACAVPAASDSSTVVDDRPLAAVTDPAVLAAAKADPTPAVFPGFDRDIEIDLGGATVAASFPLTVSARLPLAPASMPVYRVQPVDALGNLARLEDALSLGGLPRHDEDFGGVEHLVDDGAHAYAYDLGGMVFHDVEGTRVMSIQPQAVGALWQGSEELLGDLGLFDLAPLALSPGAAMARVNEAHDQSGAVTGSWVSAQRVSWEVSVDGWPAFGGGSEVSVTFGAKGAVIGLSSALRELSAVGSAPVIGPREALEAWVAQAAQTGRLNVLRVGTPHMQEVEVTGLTLGYWMSDSAQERPVVVPAWEIEGVIHHLDDHGAPTTAPLRWYQPAAAGLSIPELSVAG